MFCNYCGKPNPDGASFCNSCGKAIARPPANVDSQEEVSPTITPPNSSEETPSAFKVIDRRACSSPEEPEEPEKVRTFWTGHTHSITALAFSPDGRYLASGSYDKTAKLWDVSTGHELRTFTGDMPFTCVDFSPDGRRLVLAASNEKPAANAITLWDSAAPEVVRNLIGHKGEVSFVKFSPDGHLLASTNGGTPFNLWDVSTGRIIKVFKLGSLDKLLCGGSGSSLAFSPDGRFLATRSRPATLWDISSGKNMLIFGPEPIDLLHRVTEFLGFTTNGKFLVQVRVHGAIMLWDVSTGIVAHCLMNQPERSDDFYVTSAALSSDGSLLAVATHSSAEKPSGKITFWDLSANQALGTVSGFDEYHDYDALAFSPDKQWLATPAPPDDGVWRIQLWRTSEIS